MNVRTNKIIALVSLLLPALLISMDVSILFVANPSISRDLAPGASEWLWMMDSYSFVVAALLVTMGSLADRIGRRRLLLLGAAAFGLASLALALAPTPGWFIAGRVMLGIGAATLAPSTLAIIRDIFTDAEARRRAVAAWTIAFTGGAVAGPVLGGFLLSLFDWPAVFLVSLPVMALLLIVGPLVLPESRNPEGARFDLPGAALSLIALLGVVYAVKRLAEEGGSPSTWAVLAGGVLVFAAFVHRQRTAAHPLIDLALFRRGDFSGAILANLAGAFVMVGLGALAFTYLQSVHGLSPLAAALWALPTFLGTAVGAALASELGKRVRPGLIISGGFLVTGAGFAFTGITATGDSIVLFMTGYTALTLGTGAVTTLANALVLTTAPAERTGAAASISETGVQLGGALGIAVFGLVSTLVYRSRMAEAPAAVPAEARASIMGAEAAAGGASPAPDAILESASASFASAVSAVSFAVAAAAVLAAVLAGILLRSVPVGAAKD